MANENLLRDPLIRVVLTDGSRTALSLAEVYAACTADRIATILALRPHQAPAWHALLVQLGVMGCEALELEAPPGDDPATWASVIRALTKDFPDDEPWSLVAPHDKPAFLQPPVPGGSLDHFKKTIIRTPDALDMLVTAKNHDTKAQRMMRPRADDWIFALASLQTQEGQMGAGNYGIARMNGGYGSRPFMRLAPKASFGANVMRDVRALLSEDWQRPGFLATRRAVKLVWLEPWDGEAQLSPDELHPLFVECCRRARLFFDGEGFGCRLAGSEASRIAARGLRGAIGDPWAPIDTTGDAKALAITNDGFSYRRTVELLFAGGQRTYEKPFLAKRRRQERGLPFRYEFAALARGQGKTEGYHTRTIDAPADAIDRIEDGLVAQLAWDRVEQAGVVWGRVLQPSLIMLYQGGPEEPDWRNPATAKLVGAWQGAYDAHVDTVYFPALWRALELDRDVAALDWAETLSEIACGVFGEAVRAAPQRAERRFIAEARANDFLSNALRKHLPVLNMRKDCDNVDG
jgi:CRISPR system Cascade subunit CasA